MLIEFSVTNFRSILTTQTMSMVASKSAELEEENTFPTHVAGLPRLLRSAVLYGPNAAGKSNLIQAVDEMRSFVLSSAKETQEGESIPAAPFLLNSASRSAPSEFEVVFIQEGVRFQYGFSVNRTRVMHEWLFAYPEGRGQRWFEREYDPVAEKESWYFGPKFTGRRQVWQEATRSNALFLSTAIQLNNEQLKPVFKWFKKLAVIQQDVLLSPGYTAEQCEEHTEKKNLILRLLNFADQTVKDILLKKESFSSSVLPRTMPPEIKEEIIQKYAGEDLTTIYLLHTAEGHKDLVPIELTEESGGTKKLFAYAGPWLDVLENGRIMLVDELNNSFHPLLVRFLISLLHNSESNKLNAQLIFTTHDTTILDQNIMRRDQVWFIEKNPQNATDIYPLTDFSPRKGEALEKGYLHGRYGALPYIGELQI